MPLPPATGESAARRTVKPRRDAFSAGARAPRAAARGRDLPPASLPPRSIRSGSSNCGLTSTTPSAPSRKRKASPRSMLRAATKLTSTVKKSNGPGARESASVFQSAPSRLSTRASPRRVACSCPWPTSTAVTWAAPWRSSASVNPPVEAPMSMARAPRIRGAKREALQGRLELQPAAPDDLSRGSHWAAHSSRTRAGARGAFSCRWTRLGNVSPSCARG